MIKLNYANAITEVLEYLKGICKENIDKIPREFIEYLNENSSKEYKANFDYTKPLKELVLLPETKGIIAFICYNYWCENLEEKDEFYSKLNENEKKIQEERREKYTEMHTNEKIITKTKEENEILAVEDENESMIRKIYKKILVFLKKINKKS